MITREAEIIEAITHIAEDADGGIDKKPNVADVEAVLGFDITATERDVAWAEFNLVGTKPADDNPSTVNVTNKHFEALNVAGVVIPVGGSADVSRFELENSMSAQGWLDAGVIAI